MRKQILLALFGALTVIGLAAPASADLITTTIM